MPVITDAPPANVQADLDALVAALDEDIPARQPDANLLIATWNIRSFGSLTREWLPGANQSPKRDLRGLRAICEIVSRFDVVAIQEVVGNLHALRDMMRFLGDDWSFLMTDVTLGDAGNNERTAYVFDRRRVRPSGLACELVVPPEWQLIIGQDFTQFAHTPYAVSFRAGDQTFILVSPCTLTTAPARHSGYQNSKPLPCGWTNGPQGQIAGIRASSHWETSTSIAWETSCGKRSYPPA